MVIGVVGFILISVRKKERDNMREREREEWKGSKRGNGDRHGG